MQTNASLEWLKEQLTIQYGEEAEPIWDGLNANRVTSLRVNTLKTTRERVLEILKTNGLSYKNPDFYSDAVILQPNTEPIIKKLEIFEAGEVYLQSLSAMIPPLVLDVQPGQDVLDMCAAPGGKTSEIVQLTDNRAMVTACEPDKIRFDRLKSNLKRLQCERVSVLNLDARKLDDFLKFDRILLDAPCSGSGTLRLDQPEKKINFSPKLVSNSAKLQAQLLKKACTLLKRGGRLVYSTCSLLQQENDAQVKSILKDSKMRLVPIDESNFSRVKRVANTVSGTMTVMPDTEFEGFYISIFEKVG